MPDPIIHPSQFSTLDNLPKAEWEKILRQIRQRTPVIFLSYCRFWEKFGFVQQSLAQSLVSQKIPVIWFDSFGWRPYHPIVSPKSPWLQVKQGIRLPLSRYSLSRKLSTVLQWNQLKPFFRQSQRPFIWVQGGIDEALAEKIPYIDAFSTFDDPYRHSPEGKLCQKSKIIFCQNQYTYDRFKKYSSLSVQLALPPVRRPSPHAPIQWKFPETFPKKKVGYLGAFKEEDFDFVALEYLIKELPQYGFVLAGRTDPAGENFVRHLSTYPNFLTIPWDTQEKRLGLWQEFSAAILCYKGKCNQDGAFPIKVLEASYFNIPVIATEVPKTAGLPKPFRRCSSLPELKEAVIETLEGKRPFLQPLYRFFAKQTDPKFQIAQAVLSSMRAV